MTGRAKQFECGHRGRGRWCHRCAAEQHARERETQQAAAVASALAETKGAFRKLFPGQSRDCEAFPIQVVERAVVVGAALAAGQSPSVLRGHRMPFDRTVFRFHLPGHYRLVVRDEGTGEMTVMSHEQYNHLFAGGGR